MRETSREGRAIVEGVERSALRQLDLNYLSVFSSWIQMGHRWKGAVYLRTCLSKALISLHLSMVASSSFGKSIDIVG